VSEPVTLAIDTATEFCSVALLGASCSEKIELAGQSHSQRLLPMIDELLREAHLAVRDVDLIAFGAGPGSFTGLRIACGVAQGLAWGAAKRIVGVGNLRALAARALAEDPGGQIVLAAIDARMNEAYCAVYQRGRGVECDEEGRGDLVELHAASLVAPAELGALAARLGADIVAGNALIAFASAWPDGADTAPPRRMPHLRFMPQLRASAADIARLARIDAQQGRSLAPHEAAPLYVRDQVALTIAQRQARLANA